MKIVGKILISIVCLVATSAHAVDIVHDPGLALQNAGNEIVNFAQWASTEIHAAATDLNTLNTYEQTVLQVERMGDPKTLTANLPGVSNVQTLAQIYQQGMKDASDWASYANPQSWQMTADQILSIYQQPALTTFTSAAGVKIGTATSLVQFHTANYNTAYGAQQTVAQLNQKLQTETQELATATSSLQAATTTSAVEKYQGIIASLQAQIAATKAALQQAELSEKLQVEQNNAAQAITQRAQEQAMQAADYQTIDQGPLQGVPVGDMDLTKTALQWGSN